MVAYDRRQQLNISVCTCCCVCSDYARHCLAQSAPYVAASNTLLPPLLLLALCVHLPQLCSTY